MIISNNATRLFYEIPRNSVIRINAAWMKTRQELTNTIRKNNKYEIYLDYPEGRTKPPKPVLLLEDVIKIANYYPQVKYFAISNAESKTRLKLLRKQLRYDIMVIPKIETLSGVDNVIQIVEGAQTKAIMLDKDDLYVNCKMNGKIYNQAVGQLRYLSKQYNFKIFELQGVIFG